MDDLLGEDWQQKPAAKSSSNPNAFVSNYSSFRASPQIPLSGNTSPANLSRPSSTVNGVSKPATPSNNDTFGNLLSLKSQKGNGGNVTMQERQRQLLEEKRRQSEQNSQLWDNLGSGRSTPALRQPSPAAQIDDEEDILAAFNKDAPVDRASHFSPPPPSGHVSGRSTPAATQLAVAPNVSEYDDDDPFGLGGMSATGNGHVTGPKPNNAGDDENDILGDLGRPVSAKHVPPAQRDESPDAPMLAERETMSVVAPEPEDDDAAGAVPQDRALAELVDMGFPADTARIALNETGGDVQNAVGWLLQQAHEESRQRARGETPSSRTRSPLVSSRSPQRRQREDHDAMPAWMRTQDGNRSTSAAGQRETTGVEKEPAQVAQEFGNKMWKSANSLWKASQKQMAKTIADLQQDHSSGDPNQPKWMRDSSTDSNTARRWPQEPPFSAPRASAVDLTDEATALDAPRDRPQKPPRPTETAPVQHARGRSPVEPLPHRPSPQPRFMEHAPSQPDRRPATKLSRQDVEDQTAQAYVSPARRKRPSPQPPSEPAAKPAEDVDLFNSPAPSSTSRLPPSAPVARPTPASKPSPAPAPPKPKAPLRTVPTISPSALQSSAHHRKAGGEHFKRGDYAAAHDAYTSALTPLPPTHPIAIVVLSNRSLTALKTGDAKVAVSDADRALGIIGPSQGFGESIDLGIGEGPKDMKEFYGKAVMRKAEALEHMEKYGEAASVWRLAVEAGIGGAVSLKGRDRCEKAAAPKPAVTANRTAPTRPSASKTPPAKALGNSLQRPALSSVASGEAVKKLRAANAEASKEEDEKFALSDSVDAKLTAWKGGKSDNLRALLQSMDIVLWPEAGWKKVGMSDLVMPAKVKIVYMKAIGKVHPDKIPQSATTEQRMISAAVFSTLNEAWDKFKTENNL